MRNSHALYAICAALAVSVAYSAFKTSEATRWERERNVALALHAESEARADSIEAHAAATIEVAAQLADSAKAVARSADERVAQVRARVVEIGRGVVPDTCVTHVAEMQQAAEDALAAAEQYKAAYEAETVVSASLRSAVDELQGVLDAVKADNARLTAVLEAAPSPRSRWIPTPSVGVYYGIDIDRMQVSRGAAVMLSWDIL